MTPTLQTANELAIVTNRDLMHVPQPRHVQKTTPVDLASYGRCIFCKRPLLTSFVYLPAVRGTNYRVTAHVHCAQLRAAGLEGDALAKAEAERDAILDGVETLFLGRKITP